MLSIVTINYNNADGLRRTAQSIRMQKERNFQWVVIDGGSTDTSVQVIHENADIISHWVSEKDRGIYHAMNKGVDASTGQYLLFLNSGDALYDADVIADFYARASHEDVVYGREVGVDAHGNVMWDWQLPPEPLRLSYFFSHTLKHQAMMISSRCFQQWRYNEEHRINSDVELTMALLYHGYSFGSWDRHVARFDTGGVSSVTVGGELPRKEFDDSISRLLPQCIIQDYRELIECRDIDVIAKSRDIALKGRIWRWALRIWIYPLHWLASRTNNH